VISKCANPECAAVFRYMHEGKLFEFEVRSLPKASGKTADVTLDRETSRQVECFWLCDACASTRTLIFEPHRHQVVVIPLDHQVCRLDDAGGDSTRKSG
jgi:hypothetical protein